MDQQTVLEELGCDAFQGYLYSPALVGERCLEYLRHRLAVVSRWRRKKPELQMIWLSKPSCVSPRQ
jgi:hypothetical protein